MKRLVLALMLPLLSCANSDAAPPRLVFDDPLGLMDVVGELRLLVFPADGRSCTADGTVSPAISDEPGTIIDDALVDLMFGTAESATIVLNVGTYVVLVRGRGTDPVSGRTGVIVATGCTANVVIEDGATREITIELQDVVGSSGVCDDGTLSPDEQCETATGPLPCSMCRTQSVVAHTTTDGAQSNPGLGWASGARYVLSFDAVDRTGPIQVMLRDATGQVIGTPTALSLDQAIDADGMLPGVQTTSAAASSAARYGVAFGDFSTAMTQGGDILVRFFDENRNPAAPAVLVGPRDAAQTNPKLAMMSDGAALVAFDDAASATGTSVVLFAAGATSPAGAPIAVGAAGSAAPSVASTATGFVVATGGSAVTVQRIGADGSVLDATPIPVSDGAAGDKTAVTALDDGRFLVAWESGGNVQARAFDMDGAPTSTVLSVGSGAAPSAGAGANRFLVAWESGGNVQARLYSGDGAEARNRESPPTPAAFTVGVGTQPQVAVGGSGQVIAAVAYVTGGDVQSRLFPLP